MEELQMLTQGEVAKLLNTHTTTITTLRELNIIPAIRTGKNYMFTRKTILEFQTKYSGMDVSNRVKALESLKHVNQAIVSA